MYVLRDVAGVRSGRGETVKIAIVNLDKIATGDWRDPLADGDTVVMEEG